MNLIFLFLVYEKKLYFRKQNFKVLVLIDINIICINNLIFNIFLVLNNSY